jgi:hypothetical protein
VQLDLFQGDHIPLTRCRAALARGELAAGRAILASFPGDGPEAADAARLAALEEGLAGATRDPAAPELVHDAFERALGGVAKPGVLAGASWFQVYAGCLAQALGGAWEASFRGWRRLHFLLAARGVAEALREAERLAASPAAPPGAWLEAARAAFAAGEEALGLRLVVEACLRAEGALEPDPPPLAPSPLAALNALPGILPRLPAAIEDLFSDAGELGLPGGTAAWVPALGALSGSFSTALLGRFCDPPESNAPSPAPAGEPAPRAFLRALLAARRAREALPATSICSDDELRARARMRAAAPPLLARYLASLGSPGAPS